MALGAFLVAINKNTLLMSNDTNHTRRSKLANSIFNYRKTILVLFGLVFIVLAYLCSQVSIEASFSKMIPTSHPYVQNFFKYRNDLSALGNSIRVIVESKDGTIFSKEYQEVLKQVTDDVFFIPGVNRSKLRSLWTPNVRWTEVTENGFVGGEVIPDKYDGSEKSLDQLRSNILKSGQLGSLVSNDYQSSLVHAPLNEVHPETGEKLSYHELSEQLEANIRQKYNSETINIRIVGFAKIVGDLIKGAAQVGLFFLITIAITSLLLLLYSRCLRSTLLVIGCSLLAVISQLGVLHGLGYGINPYSMLVPFLIFAIGVSHGVQMVNAMIHNTSENKLSRAKYAFTTLIIAGLTALISDAIGFTTLMVIKIQVIRELAISASIGVALIIITNLIVLPLLLSYSGVNSRKPTNKPSIIVTLFSRFSTKSGAIFALISALIIAGFGYTIAQDMKIGDLDAGAPELRPNSRYNQDNAYLVEHYSNSTDVFVMMVETEPEQCVAYEHIILMDKYQWMLKNMPEVQNALSLADVVKFGNLALNEGSLKWFGFSRNPSVINATLSRIPAGLMNSDCTMAPILVFLNDHKAETLSNIVTASKDFAAEHSNAKIQFTLAAGNAGIEAATNEVIQASQTKMLIWVYSVVIILCFIAFRSFRSVICVILPLMLTSMLCQALMAKLNIGVKVATLPVIALGVGIGVDYGIYIFSRMQEALNKTTSLFETYKYALTYAGNAVAFTGITLAIGVFTWTFSPIKFQADMGVLLTFMFIFNMLGALILLPALSWLLGIKPKPVSD